MAETESKFNLSGFQQSVDAVLKSLGSSTTAIKDYGNGVYYFPGKSDDEFGNSLSKYIGEHPELSVVCISSTGGIGVGYFVIFKKVNKEA
jgi:hypothetical protein